MSLCRRPSGSKVKEGEDSGPRPCKDSYESVPVKEEPVEERGRASNDPGMAKPAEPPEAGEQQPSGPGPWGCLLLPQDRVLGLVVEVKPQKKPEPQSHVSTGGSTSASLWLARW